VLVAGGGGLGGPDGVQDGEVVGVGQGLLAGLGRGQLLAAAFQHASQHAEGFPGGGCWSGLVAGSGGEAVVAGEFGGRAGAGDRVGLFGGPGEHVREVDVRAAGQGDKGVRAVLGPSDHRQAGMDGVALGGVVGDRVAEFGIVVAGEQEVSVGPAPLPSDRVGVQGPADDQAVGGDGVDAEQVAVGQCPAGLPRLDGVIVLGADDQVARAGYCAVADADGGPSWTMPRAIRSSRMRRDSSRRSA
jgi:hypothetical protein